MTRTARKLPHLDQFLDAKKPGQRNEEGQIQDAIRLELGDPRTYADILLYRNNIGVLQDKEGNFVRYGVGSPGGADLIGIFTSKSGLGRFIAAEIKSRTGQQSDEQKRFQKLVESKGGSYAVLRSVDEAREWIARLRKGAV